MYLSIVIPVYNEVKKIAKDIRAASEFLQLHHLTGQLIVVDDGSTDGSIQKASEEASSLNMAFIAVENEHRGKGFAVKTGILKAESDIIMFIDSGSCVPFDNILPGLKMIDEGKCDIAHGSRLLPDSTIYGKSICRQIISWIFRKLVSMYLNIPGHLTDTQCGLKIYSASVAHDLFRMSITEGFMFDLEIILRAEVAGYRITEFPIEWTADPDSRLSLYKNFMQMIRELKLIKKIIK